MAKKAEGSIGHHMLVSFLPPPNIDCTLSNVDLSDHLRDVFDRFARGYHCAKDSPVMRCIDSYCGNESLVCGGRLGATTS